MQRQQAEMEALMMAIYTERLPSNTKDIYQHILHEQGSVDRYSVRVLGNSNVDESDSSGESEPSARLGGSDAKQQLQIGIGPLVLGGPLMSSIKYIHSPGTRVRFLVSCTRMHPQSVVLPMT
jgi:hypothetical protein